MDDKSYFDKLYQTITSSRYCWDEILKCPECNKEFHINDGHKTEYGRVSVCSEECRIHCDFSFLEENVDLEDRFDYLYYNRR